MSAPNANRRHSSSGEASSAVGSSVNADFKSTNDLSELEQVCRLEAPRLARYFRARMRPGEDVADLAQESFVRLAGSMARAALPRLGAYLQRIARNLLYDQSKRVETRLAAFHIPIGEGNEPGIAADQEHGLEADDVMRVYLSVLEDLAPKTREVFLLHRVDELTYREIGLKLAITVPTVQYHVARALAHIYAALDRG